MNDLTCWKSMEKVRIFSPCDIFQLLGFAVAERPQQMLMRVSVGIHKHDIDAAIEVWVLFCVIKEFLFTTRHTTWCRRDGLLMPHQPCLMLALASHNCPVVSWWPWKMIALRYFVLFSNILHVILMYFRVFMKHSRLVLTFLNLLEGLASTCTVSGHVVATLLEPMARPMGWSLCWGCSTTLHDM